MDDTAASSGSDRPRRRAFVTGASEGLGRAFVKKLAHAGYRCVAVARNEARLRELIDQLQPEDHEWMVADLATREGLERCAARLSEEHFDLLVNNAGFGRFGPFHESTATEQEQILDVDCRAVLILAHAFLGGARPGDALINLSSVPRLRHPKHDVQIRSSEVGVHRDALKPTARQRHSDARGHAGLPHATLVTTHSPDSRSCLEWPVHRRHTSFSCSPSRCL
jgi:NAD(P)-dependent dehydrogenase (short-subunit alcohol dehydrogenase family)